jgi:hypothetical protein
MRAMIGAVAGGHERARRGLRNGDASLTTIAIYSRRSRQRSFLILPAILFQYEIVYHHRFRRSPTGYWRRPQASSAW